MDVCYGGKYMFRRLEIIFHALNYPHTTTSPLPSPNSIVPPHLAGFQVDSALETVPKCLPYHSDSAAFSDGVLQGGLLWL
jgi:hypothetical protein